MRLDLHVHSRVSRCSVLGPEDILARARAMGLDGVCITDHDTTAVSGLVREGVQEDGLVVLIGMEYSAPEGDFLLFGPVEGLPLGRSARLILPLLWSLGGAAVAAHPCRSWRPLDPEVLELGLGLAMETCNGRTLLSENEKARSLAKAFGLPATGGSDAHALDEMGLAVTRFSRPVSSRENLVQALREGDCAPELTPLGRRRFRIRSHAAWA